MNIIEEYLVIPAEHVEQILSEWLTKYFGHILTGRTDTAEYARIHMAHADLKAQLAEKVVSTAPIAISEPATVSLPIETPIEAPIIEEAPVKVSKAKKADVIEAPQEQVAPVEIVLPIEDKSENIDNNPSK